VAFFQPLVNQFPDEINVVNSLGEAYFAAGAGGSQDMLYQAAGQFDKIINFYNDEGPGPNNAYPDLYWNAWLRRLQVLDRLGENTGDIPLRVKQLRLTDPMLGGEPYKGQFERLETKYAGTQ
jgi:hypothetical protein